MILECSCNIVRWSVLAIPYDRDRYGAVQTCSACNINTVPIHGYQSYALECSCNIVQWSVRYCAKCYRWYSRYQTNTKIFWHVDIKQYEWYQRHQCWDAWPYHRPETVLERWSLTAGLNCSDFIVYNVYHIPEIVQLRRRLILLILLVLVQWFRKLFDRAGYCAILALD